MSLRDVDGDAVTLQPGEDRIARPGACPIRRPADRRIGLAISAPATPRRRRRCSSTISATTARPTLNLRRPAGRLRFLAAWPGSMASASSQSAFRRASASRRIAARASSSHGTRQWTDYRVSADILVHLGDYGGVAVRVQGLRRYYGALLTRQGTLRIVKVRDDETTVLAETLFAWNLEAVYQISVDAVGDRITCSVGGKTLVAHDGAKDRFTNGGIALIVARGALSSNDVRVGHSA